jgi:hypothetical protein
MSLSLAVLLLGVLFLLVYHASFRRFVMWSVTVLVVVVGVGVLIVQQVERHNAERQAALQLEECINSSIEPIPWGGDALNDECAKGWKLVHCNPDNDEQPVWYNSKVGYCRNGRKLSDVREQR